MSHPRPQIPSLDGIRAISFLIVFLAHAGFYDKVPGGMGVTIFFFLSGYLITTLLRVELDTTGTLDLRRFYLRRVLRIFPPFYAFLAVSLLAAFLWVVPTKVTWEGVGAQILYLYNYYAIVRGPEGIPPGTDVYWSLAVEEHFYLVFPFAYLLLHRRVADGRGRALWLGAVCAAVL
ncbi:MAG: acyltransferase family protein, partial [Armatimonadota bacterium]